MDEPHQFNASADLEPQNGRKRKWSQDGTSSIHSPKGSQTGEDRNGDSSGVGDFHHEELYSQPKRIKTETGNVREHLDKSTISGEVWQHIFTFLPPTSLGRLLRVNRSFHKLLTATGIPPSPQIPSSNVLSFQSKESVWSASRRLFFPGMPRPLQSVDEIDMWKLVRSRKCQFCGKQGSLQPPKLTTAPWTSGPGDSDVRIIWPFKVRSCTDCLKPRVRSEMQLLLSSDTPSFLLPALPFAYFTQAFNYVVASTMKSNAPEEPPTRYYLDSHLHIIKEKLAEVKAMGPATAEEWIKGLANSGKDKLADASRWEQWEVSNGLHELLAWKDSPIPLLKFETNAPAPTEGPLPGNSGLPQIPPVTLAPLNQPTLSRSMPQMPQIPVPSTLPPKPQTPKLSLHNPYPSQPRPIHTITPIQPHIPQPRMERSIKDVNEAKAARRADIERRCAQLEPPLTPSVLIHMESFAAAIQIPIALNDSSWEVLKPRLLAQRETAEEREEEQRMQSQILQRMTEERRQQEASLKEAKEILDREWDEVQKPVREKVNIYADEIIQTQWRGGDSVTKELCPKFAADVLVYVRERFYHVQKQEDAMMEAARKPLPANTPNAAPTRTLILENMKSVFDAKIKPLTEHYQKEIFLCNGCDSTAKWYGFEGVVQHYAAKHTSTLSSGTIVVWWRAAWPEFPPFNPNPTPFRGIYGNVSGEAPPSLSASALPIPHIPTTSERSSNFGQAPNNPLHSEGYSSRHYGYPPSAGLESPSSTPFATTQRPNWSYASSAPNEPRASPYQQSPQNPYPQYSPFPTPVGYHPPDYSAHLSYSNHQPYQQRPSVPPYSSQTQRSQPQSSFTMPTHVGAPGQPFGIYQVQLDELSRNAREVWDGTSGIHGLPSSVRIHVIINHVVLRFKDRFTNEPNLALFTDGLNNSSQMKPIRNLSDLTCKSCAMTGGNLDNASRPSGPPPAISKLHTLPALLAHFQAIHIEKNRLQIVPQTGIEPPRLDWKFDMVQLPDATAIKDLIHAPGMDNAKLGLIAAVLPTMFPNPLPRIEPAAQALPIQPVDYKSQSGPHGTTNGKTSPFIAYSASSDNNASQTPTDRAHGLEVAVDDFPKFIESPLHNPAEPVEPAKDDEYDPHRPAYIDPPRDEFGRFEHHRSRVKQSPSQITASQPSQMLSQIQKHEGRGPLLKRERMSGSPRFEQAPITYERGRIEMHPGQIATMGGSNQDVTPIPRPASDAFQNSESISAAEHFLNNFDPTEDREESKPAVQASNADHGVPRSLQNTPSGIEQHHAIFSRRLSPSTGDVDRREILRRADERAYTSSGRRKDDLLQDVDEYRYIRNDHGHAGGRYVVDPEPRRSSSRFDRYEAQRHESQQARSRSPHPAEPSSSAIYYRERSPPHPHYQRRVYSGQPPVDMADEYSATENQSYTRVPAARQYQYIDSSRYADSYNGPVEYVRVAPRDSSAPNTYYVERAGQNGFTNEFEREIPRGEYIEHNGQLYTRAHPADRQDPYPPRVRYM